jgi:hypothetical protein
VCRIPLAGRRHREVRIGSALPPPPPFSDGQKSPSGAFDSMTERRDFQSSVSVVSVAVLTFAAFAALLGFNAQRRYGTRLQALHANLLTRFEAIAI